MSPVSPCRTLPGVWENVSQMEGPRPSSSTAPSIWYEAVAVPHKNPSGNRAIFSSFTRRLRRRLSIIGPPRACDVSCGRGCPDHRYADSLRTEHRMLRPDHDDTLRLRGLYPDRADTSDEREGVLAH